MTEPTSAAQLPPLPAPDRLTAFYWEALRRHELAILRCQGCGHYVHYPRPICDRCQSTDLTPEVVSGEGTLYSHTSVMQAFHPYFVDRIPYVLAVVELVEEPGLRVTTNIVGVSGDELAIGMPLRVLFEDINDEVTLAMFEPAGRSE